MPPNLKEKVGCMTFAALAKVWHLLRIAVSIVPYLLRERL